MPIKLRISFVLLIVSLLLWPSQAVQARAVLAYFRASSDPDGIMLEWATSSETDNQGFYLLRSTRADGIYESILWILSESVDGEGQTYQYLDNTLTDDGVYYYKLEAIDADGGWEFFGPVYATYGALSGTVTPTQSSTSTKTLQARMSVTPTGTTASAQTPTKTSQVGITVTSTGTSVFTQTPTNPSPDSSAQTLTPTATWTNTESINPYPGNTPTSQELPQSTASPTMLLDQSPTVTLELGTNFTNTLTLETNQQFTREITATSTIDLLFPSKLTSTPLPTQSITLEKAIVPETTPTPEAHNPGRSYALLSIPILLWIALSVFLILFIRKAFEVVGPNIIE